MAINIVFSVLTFLAIGLVIALPATLTLRPGLRPGLERLTIDAAALQLSKSNSKGWHLVKEATLLVHNRMQYCRRNSFDHYGRAFERGYGYCQQNAYALRAILTMLGFQARVVQSFRNRFPDGKVGSHAWVEVRFNGESRYFDGVFAGADGNPAFTPLAKVYSYSGWFRILAGWGSIPVNAIRYYVSGKDLEDS